MRKWPLPDTPELPNIAEFIVSPKHSIDFCPICGGGLCGVLVCGINSPEANPHGLIVCDECEAIWLQPDLTSDHQYPDPGAAQCPICRDALWGPNSRWADETDLKELGWNTSVNRELDVGTDEGIA